MEPRSPGPQRATAVSITAGSLPKALIVWLRDGLCIKYEMSWTSSEIGGDPGMRTGQPKADCAEAASHSQSLCAKDITDPFARAWRRKQNDRDDDTMAINTDGANFTDSAAMTRYPCTIVRQIFKPEALAWWPRHIKAIESHRTLV